MSSVPFCTCTDTACPNHPGNQELGCTPCIAKNLANGEIPSCFFASVDMEKPTDGWYYADFASLVTAAKAAGKL